MLVTRHCNLLAGLAALGILCSGAGASRIHAQVNIESQRQVSSDSGFSGTLGTSLLLRTGNVEHFRLGVRGRVDYETSSTSTFAVGRGTVGLLGDNRFNNAGLLHLRHGRRWHPRFLVEGYAQVNYDEPRRLDLRNVVGGGIRAGIIDSASLSLWVGTGYMFEYERLDLPDTASHPRTNSTHRWSSYLAGRLTAGTSMTIVATVYTQPRFDDLADFRILSDVNFAASITGALSFTASFELRYDNRPPDDVASLDTELRNGISVAF
jgi:hypothetical protein